MPLLVAIIIAVFAITLRYGGSAPAIHSAAATQTQGAQFAQQHSADACGDDQECLRLWYAEYKPAIIHEFMNWREFEDDVADYIATDRHYFIPDGNGSGRFDPTTTAILHDIAEGGGGYRHLNWSFPHVQEIQGVDTAALDALLWSCRVAIIDMKYMLASASGDDWSSARERKDTDTYLKDVRDCERFFNLPKSTSRLRNQ